MGAGGDGDLASGAVGMAAAMEEEREAEQAARQGQQVCMPLATIPHCKLFCLLDQPFCEACLNRSEDKRREVRVHSCE